MTLLTIVICGTRDRCLEEAREITRLYVDMFNRLRTWRWIDCVSWMPIVGPVEHYHAGWMCYQWQHHTYHALESFLESSRCFEMERVGRLDPPSFLPGHNWVAITVLLGSNAKSGACTVYLDPWWNSNPSVFPSDDADAHDIHNGWLNPQCVITHDGLTCGGIYQGVGEDVPEGREFDFPPWQYRPNNR